ncbi:MAG: FAD:protein FMN transferase, partial [Acidobacteriota bacterium]
PREVAATVTAGGDLRMRPGRHEPWAVEGPDGRRCRALLTVPMQGEAVATSATTLGAEGSSIVCPHRREPVTARRSVSVFASTAMEADALAKVAFLLPGGHPIWRQVSATALVVDRHARTHWLGRV